MTNLPPQPWEEKHIGALDGLRAIAIVLVLLVHLTPGHDSNLGIRALPFKIADVGWSGVDLFFVLSGFLITRGLLRTRDEENRFGRFYARRTLRIFPLYYLTVAIVFALSAPSFREQLPYWLYYSNFNDVSPDFGSLQLGHFWSLAIEEQFYLVWPAVIFLTPVRFARRFCIALLAVALLLRFALVMGGASWVATLAWTPCRADGLAVGAFLALAYADERLRTSLRRWIVPVMLVSAPILGWTAWKDRSYAVWSVSSNPEAMVLRVILPFAFALFYGALLVAALELRPVARLLTGRVQSAIARYSYGIYVFHYLLWPLFRAHIPQWNVSANTNAAAFFVIASSISTALAVLSYHTVESFFLSMKPK